VTVKIRLALSALLLVLLGLLGARLQLTDDLGSLLPGHGPLPRALELLQRFQVADTLLVEIDGTGQQTEALLAATDQLGQRLDESAAIRRVRWRVQASDGVALQRAVAPHALDLVPGDVLAERLSPQGLQRSLQGQLLKLAGPGGSMFEAAFLQDPLDLSGLALQQLRAAGGPFRIETAAGHFMDASGQRAVLFVEPVAPAVEMGPGAPLMAELQQLLATCPLPARYLGGHRVAAESAQRIFDDVQRAALAGAVLLVVLFLAGFRSFRPVLGGLGPLLPAAAATLAAGAIMGPLHGINLGFTAALLGLSVDYWIHLYVAAARLPAEPGFSGRLAAGVRALRSIGPALLLGAGSTMGAFGVLCASSFPVLRNLGAMGLAAAAGALLGTWLLGPLAFALVGSRALPSPRLAGLPRWTRLMVLALTALGLLCAARSSFDGDPRNLLPPAPETQALEREFSDRYGGFGTGGMVVLEHERLGDALDAADRVQAALAAVPGVDSAGPGLLLPGPALRSARRADLPDSDELQTRIDAAAAALGFAPQALAGAAQRLLAPASAALEPQTWAPTPLAELTKRHVQRSAAGWSVMISLVLGDEAQLEPTEAMVLAAAPQAELVVPTRFAAQGVEQILHELLRLSALSAAWVLLLLVLRYRRPRPVLAAFSPCLAAVAWTVGGMALLDIPWNAVSAGGMVLILGLALDYGVFMLEGARREAANDTGYAVIMSALTTTAGFGILAIARAPALYAVGLAVLLGMVAAAATSLSLVPSLVRGEPLLGSRLARWLTGLVLAALLLFHLDLLATQIFFLSPPAAPAPPTHELSSPAPGDQRYGPNRVLLAEGIRSAYLEGSPYERGYAAGLLTGEMDLRLEQQLLGTFASSVPNAIARFGILRGVMLGANRLDRHFLPEQLQEIHGYTDAAEDRYDWMAPAYTRKVYYHAIHDIGQALVDTPVVMACTGFMAGGAATVDGHWLLARNFDFDGGSLFDQEKLVVFMRPDDGIPFVSISFAGMSGVMTGLNQEGLAVALQAGASEAPIRPGMPMTLIARELLQYASSLDEAEEILRQRKGFVSENVLVADGDAGEAALFEVSPQQVARLPVEGSLGVSNHFRTAGFSQDATNLLRQEENTTVPRLERMEELLRTHHGQLDMARAAEILKDRCAPGGKALPRGHRWAMDADIATHGAVIDASARRLWVSRYPNLAGGFVAYDLEQGLAGQLTPVEVVPAQQVRRTLDVHRARVLLRQAHDADAVEAEALARRALELMPDHPQALQALALALDHQGRHEEAAEPARQALEAPPEYAHQVRELQALLLEAP